MVHRDICHAVVLPLIKSFTLLLGITFFSDILSRALAGKFLPLPVMVGNTLKDGDVFVAGLEQLDFGFKIPLITRLASDLMTKLIFSCPSGVTANAYTRANISTWRYRYDGKKNLVYSNLSLTINRHISWSNKRESFQDPSLPWL